MQLIGTYDSTMVKGEVYDTDCVFEDTDCFCVVTTDKRTGKRNVRFGNETQLRSLLNALPYWTKRNMDDALKDIAEGVKGI